ncbi:MAG TPA: hypothetical protein VFR12_12745 [Pyrinomonadaceae bacterium]|nr:hypothetical protein [Pyrinomonadaceae bacterium]
MTRRHTLACVLILLLACVVCGQTPTAPAAPKRKAAPIDPNKFAVIINGASGEPEYAKQFEQWTNELSAVLSERFGFESKQVKVLSEKPADTTAARATAEEVKRTFATLKSQLTANNILFLFLIGHGSFDGKEAKFNLVGPDLSATEYNALLSALPTRRVVVFNMASASGEFIKALAAKGRIVVTATRNGQETNATRFAGFFIAALNATDADTDQDGHTSVLETFVYANRLTGDFYKRAGRLASEHAMIDDNGDGVGHEKVEAGEGLLARATYLDSLSVDEAAASAATGKLIKERARLEGEIEQLIARKGSMQEAEYEAMLERLFVELAKVNRSIKQAGS